MPRFGYTALDATGKRITGQVEAADQEAAVAAVNARGVFVVEMKEDASTAGGRAIKRARISKSELALFARRLADLSNAGLPLDRALQVISEQTESQALATVIGSVLVEVRGGLSVSAALAMHPKVFPDVFVQTLKAGEASGQFGPVATRLAELLEREVARRSQLVSALVYPSILALTAVGVVFFLMFFVVPRLSGVFKDLGSDLPFTTRMLLASTEGVMAHWPVVVGVLIGLVVVYRLWVRSERGAALRDAWILKLPLAGPVVTKSVVSRYAMVLGTLVFGGVPILEALRLAGMSTGNRVFQTGSEQLEGLVRDGNPLAEAMKQVGGFPPVLTHMVAIGEETGNLPDMLERVSNSLDFEVDTGLRRLMSMVEPVIVLGMGVFVGFVVLSVLLPIYEAQNLVK